MKLVVVLVLALGTFACGSKKPATTTTTNNVMKGTGGNTYGGDAYGGNKYGHPAGHDHGSE